MIEARLDDPIKARLDDTIEARWVRQPCGDVQNG